MGPPCPPLPLRVPVPEDPAQAVDLSALPRAPGLFALEDDRGRTVALAITADVRRMVRERLRPADRDAGPSRRVDYRSVTRCVRAMRIGSGFEGEWAYLQLARHRLPTTYRTLLERWRGWFVHCDPEAEFPRFVATAEPDHVRPETVLGPLPDRAATQRSIDALEETFDLCRYHHILREAPHGTACAYKEMGKCPAPCDGTVTMEDYRRSVRKAAAFLGDVAGGRGGLERDMRTASEALDFERAERLRRRLETSAPLADARARFVDRLSRFRFVACMPSERAGHARIFLIAGGWIAPWADVSAQFHVDELDELATALDERLAAQPVALDAEARENLGLVCRALFGPTRAGAGMLLPAPDGIAREQLAAALRSVGGEADGGGPSGEEIRDAVIEAEPPAGPDG
ncbi:MAG: hypothetical protein GY715_06645 [Planctomycetes bacterium]|nr:hypothetical protein [Planctomycetota bacterium]